jgi:hypothetical protein
MGRSLPRSRRLVRSEALAQAQRRRLDGRSTAGLGLLDADFNGDIALIACFAASWMPAMIRRHADPFGFLRPWNEVPALIGSAPPATSPSTGTCVVVCLMGYRLRPGGQWLSSLGAAFPAWSMAGPATTSNSSPARPRLRQERRGRRAHLVRDRDRGVTDRVCYRPRLGPAFIGEKRLEPPVSLRRVPVRAATVHTRTLRRIPSSPESQAAEMYPRQQNASCFLNFYSRESLLETQLLLR